MKKFKILSFAILAMFMLTGCTSKKAYTYNVETGDSIKVELNTSDGHDITSDLPFTISKDGETLSQGTFISIDGYNQYIDAINGDSNARIIESENKNGITYTFYSYNGSEFNYIIKIDGSNTGVLLGNPNSESEAKECFDRLTFSKE